MTPDASAINHPRWLPFVFVLCVATMLGGVAAGQHHLQMEGSGGDLSLRHAILMGFPYWYLWALLSPLVVWFARRVPIYGPGRPWRILAHVVFAIAVTLIHSTLEIGSRNLFGIYMAASIQEFTLVSLVRAGYVVLYDLLAYAVILGSYYAVTLYQRLRERDVAASRLEAQLATARLQALSDQLKPHFFFNAMNTVAMLVRSGENERAVRTLAGLSDLLRHVLATEAPAEVPLREELDFVDRYLGIERIRFGERLRTTIEASEDVLDAMVPTLLLQPLVENAIRHGVSRRAGAGRIEIRAARRDERLLLSVRDDGAGLNGGRDGTSHGVGLRNTRARLQQLYGHAQALRVSDVAENGGGACVEIELPFRSFIPADGAGLA